MTEEQPDAALRRQDLIAGRGPIAAAIGFAFLALYTLSIALVPIRADNDCWWHVKTGRIIAESGLPAHDVIAYPAEHLEWHNHEWLTQLAMWKTWEAGETSAIGGWRAVILLKSLALCACSLVLLVLARRLSGSWWIALLVAVVAVGIGRRSFYPRPPVVSNVLLAGVLLLVVGVQEGWWRRRWLWTLPPVFAVWTNLHGAWMAGGVVLAALAGQDGFAWLCRRRWKSEPPDWVRGLASREPVPMALWTGVGAATIAATLCNPYGWQLYLLPGRVMSDKALVASLGELRPPDYRYVFDMPLAVGILLVIAAATLVRGRRNTSVRLGELAIFAFFLWQGAMHIRHLLLFQVAMVPLAARVLGDALRPAGRTAAIRFGAAALVTAGWSAMVLSNWPQQASYPGRNAAYLRDRTGYDEWRFPKALCDFVELAELQGRMFNENNYAGYLIWRFSPETHKVFSDSRFDIFGGDIWRQENLVVHGFEPEPGEDWPSWREVLDKWDVQWAIVRSPPDHENESPGPLESRMTAPDSGWRIVADWSALPQTHSDFQIWVRDSEENASMIRRARRIFESRNDWSLDP